MDTNCSDGMLSYQVPPKSAQERSEENDELFGQLRKIRIFIEDEGKKLTGVEHSEEENNLEDKEVKQPFTIVEKIRISDTVNGDEIRFPAADCHLQKYSVYELSAIWPDKPPIPSRF